MTKNVSVPEGYKKTELGVIPEEWEVVKLSDVCSEALSGGTPSTSKISYWGGDIPWMTSSNISNMYIINGQKCITEEGLNNSASKVIPKNNLIVATRVGLGKVAINLIDVSISQDLTGLIIYKKKADYIFLYWILKLYESKIIAYAQGTTIKGILKTDLLNIKLPLPPLSYQQKIASILSKVDEQIEQTEQIIEKTEILKKGLMQKLLTKGMGHTEFKKTEIGKIPEEWDVVKLGDYSKDIRYGYTESSNKDKIGPKFLRITDIQNGSVDWDSVPYCNFYGKDFGKYELKHNDIVFARTGATTGKSYLIKSPPKSVFASYLIKVSTNDKMHPDFVYYFFQTLMYWKQINSNISGSTQGGVNASKLSNLKIVLAPLPEQQKIASILSKVDSHIQDNQSYLHKLQELKKGLMQDLLTGKVRVCV